MYREGDGLTSDAEVLGQLRVGPATPPQIEKLALLLDGQPAATPGGFHALSLEHCVQRSRADGEQFRDGRDSEPGASQCSGHRLTLGAERTWLAWSTCGFHV